MIHPPITHLLVARQSKGTSRLTLRQVPCPPRPANQQSRSNPLPAVLSRHKGTRIVNPMFDHPDRVKAIQNVPSDHCSRRKVNNGD
jgi:hypothetical protein